MNSSIFVSPRRLFAYLAVLVTALALAGLPGCATVGAPLEAAQTSEQKAFALYGTFVIFEELAVDIAENPKLPRELRKGVIDADKRAKPIVDNLLDVTLEARKIREDVMRGTNTEERLAIATANLDEWIAQTEPFITQLIAAVRAGQ